MNVNVNSFISSFKSKFKNICHWTTSTIRGIKNWDKMKTVKFYWIFSPKFSCVEWHDDDCGCFIPSNLLLKKKWNFSAK